MVESEQIGTRIRSLRDRIARAEERAGRPPGSVMLMAVTKTVPQEQILSAYHAGLRLFGENRIQEAGRKFGETLPGAEVHLIGHLQRNKARQAASLFSWVQSIDRIETAQVLSDACGARETIMQVLLEVNTSGEASKHGVEDRDQLFRLLEDTAVLPNLAVRGLMTIAPFVDDEPAIRRSFRMLRELFDSVRQHRPDLPMDTLSMGMSGDFEIAVEEGATMVRIGTALFGSRGTPPIVPREST